MTWKEFKDQVESQGVTDDMIIQYIDVNCGFDVEYLTEINVIIHKNTFDVVS